MRIIILTLIIFILTKFILKYLKNKDNKFSFIDVGSNIGLIIRHLYLKKPNIKTVYCIKLKKNYDILINNLFSIKSIHTYNYALINKKSGERIIFR